MQPRSQADLEEEISRGHPKDYFIPHSPAHDDAEEPLFKYPKLTCTVGSHSHSSLSGAAATHLPAPNIINAPQLITPADLRQLLQATSQEVTQSQSAAVAAICATSWSSSSSSSSSSSYALPADTETKASSSGLLASSSQIPWILLDCRPHMFFDKARIPEAIHAPFRMLPPSNNANHIIDSASETRNNTNSLDHERAAAAMATLVQSMDMEFATVFRQRAGCHLIVYDRYVECTYALAVLFVLHHRFLVVFCTERVPTFLNVCIFSGSKRLEDGGPASQLVNLLALENEAAKVSLLEGSHRLLSLCLCFVELTAAGTLIP